MRTFLLLLLCVLPTVTTVLAQKKYTQAAENYFNSIRQEEALLTAFCQQMPKGGDLHHHYSGSVYTETYIEYVIERDFWLNTNTMDVHTENPMNDKTWVQFSALRKDGSLGFYKQKMLEKWSVKDYHPADSDLPQDKHFFTAFSYFRIANVLFNESNWETYKSRLQELKYRAKTENVSYIETAFTYIPCPPFTADLKSYNDSLRLNKNNKLVMSRLLDTLYQNFLRRGVKTCAEQHSKQLEKLHQEAQIDDNKFMMRYQNYAIRIIEPVDVFGQIVTAMWSAEASPLIVGVNFVAPEDNELSMQDYELHMLLFNYCKQKFPTVKTSLHAGELALGMVKPEDLTWHINEAVNTAGAVRIGHGADIAHEKNSYALLDKMKKEKIAVEINLSSNEFVLQLKNDKHPLALYRERGVPIVICTDDAGVLRTNLTEQFILLAKRYPKVTYKDMKQYIYNSILFSFIEENEKKQQLLQLLDSQFEEFEKQFAGK